MLKVGKNFAHFMATKTLLCVKWNQNENWVLTASKDQIIKVRNKVLESRGAILSLISWGVEIVLSLGLYWSALVYDFLVGRDEEVVPFRAQQLRNLLCDLGSSFIKAGQVLANRPDIIREDYMNELCILQDDVPSFPNQIII